MTRLCPTCLDEHGDRPWAAVAPAEILPRLLARRPDLGDVGLAARHELAVSSA